MPSSPRRSDGFSGQTLLVVPPPQQRPLARHPLLGALHVTDAGFFPRAPGHFVHRPEGCPGHVLIVCLRGAGWAETDGRRLALARGDVLALRAGRPHRYGATEDEPWSIAWAHFAGREADAWLEFAFGAKGTGALLCHIPPERLPALGFDRVHAAMAEGYGPPELLESAAALRACLIALSRHRAPRGATTSARERVAASVARLRTEWTRPHRVPELAAAAGVSITHYTAIFRRLTGFPPIDFLLRLRVQQAAGLLATGELPVGAVAAACGFPDAYYFTRCFTRVMGESPRRHRARHHATAGGER